MASPDFVGRWERIAAAVYFVLYLAIFTVLFDWVSNTYPFSPGVAQWRYGALGLLGGFLLIPLICALLVLLLAAALYHRSHAMVITVLSAVVAVVLLLAIGGFLLDSVQVRADVPVEQRNLFDFAVGKSLFKLFTSAIAFGLTALVGRRLLATMTDRTPKHKDGKPLVVGS